MADADRDSDLGDDSPVSARSEGETSPDQSCESSDEGVGRDAPATHQTVQSHAQHHPQPQQLQQQHTISHLPVTNHQPMNNHNHTISHQQHQRNSPRHDRDIKVRDDFEALKSSLHPHLSSLASLAQGAPLAAPNNVFALAGGGGTGAFQYTQPAFLAPAPPPPAQPVGSGSSSSSEGSAAGWSFEEQYKQVRQLYEISDDPQRKEFLDDLFSYMQKRGKFSGTPINRLPIMAKSVLDLYELYNLVIARGGLVEVINKKLWQEIIKGLRLPSSITSAAFTLRTQYMKYLYDYECEKKNLSTRPELDAAIEGNKREGRRSSGQYDPQAAQAAALAMPPLSRGVPVSLAQLSQHIQPLSLALGGGVAGLPRLPPMPPHPSQIPPNELDYRMRDYLKMFQGQTARNGSESPPGGGPSLISPRDTAALNALDMSRLALWTLYNNNNNSAASPPHADVEPQRYGRTNEYEYIDDDYSDNESLTQAPGDGLTTCHGGPMNAVDEALNLSESPVSNASGSRRDSRSPAPAAKRRHVEHVSPVRAHSAHSSHPAHPAHPAPAATSPSAASAPPVHAATVPRAHTTQQHMQNGGAHSGVIGANFKITSRGDASTGDQQLVVSIELNGTTFHGVLYPTSPIN